MQRSHYVLLLMLCGWLLSACQKWDGIDIHFQEPPKVDSIMGVVPKDLVEAFGEEYFHFGPNPPNLSDLSFQVAGLQYVKAIRYVFGPNDTPILSQAEMPPMDMTTYLHHFFNATSGIAGHRLKTIDPYNNQFLRENDTVFIIGNGANFTAYYIDSVQEPASGHPVNAILISGTIMQDTNTFEFLGIKDYRIGKKILRYGHHPSVNAYAPGTIEIKQHAELCPAYIWDTLSPSKH